MLSPSKSSPLDNRKYRLNNELWTSISPKQIKKDLDINSKFNSYDYLNEYIKKFIYANKSHLNAIKYETINFIKDVDNNFPSLFKYVSFSGGKDSTVISDLVIKALFNPSILHIFCDTTLEYTFTLEYIKRLQKNHPKMVIKEIKNKEHNFYKVCDDIGVPTRTKRWCCTIFKTGVTSKFFNNFF